MEQIWPLRRWLRAKLSRQVAITAIFMIISLVLTLGLLSYFFTRHMSLGNIHNQLDHETNLVAQRLELELNHSAQMAERLSVFPLIRNAIVDSTGRKSYLAPFVNQYRISLLARCDVVLADFSGEVIASNYGRTQRITSDWYQFVMATKQPRVAIDQDGESLRLSLAWPIIFPYTRESEGVLIVQVDLREMLVNLGLSQGETLIQLRQGDKPVLFGAIFDENSVLQKGQPLSLKPPLDQLDLRLVVATNKDQALAPLNTLAAIHVLSAALAILVAVSLLVVFTRRMVAPIFALSQVARDVHETGNLDVDVPVGREDELGILAKAFSSMLAKLSRRQEQLEALVQQRTQEISLSEAKYRLIAENTSDVIWLMDVASGRFTYVSPSVERLTGLTAGEAQEQTLAQVLTPESYRLVLKLFPPGSLPCRPETNPCA
jgi:PAS domain-containing protein